MNTATDGSEEPTRPEPHPMGTARDPQDSSQADPTPRRPARAGVVVLALGIVAALLLTLGWVVGSGAHQSRPLHYQPPAVPDTWVFTARTYGRPPYYGVGPTARIDLYTVPDPAKAEARAYVAALEHHGWQRVDWNEYLREYSKKCGKVHDGVRVCSGDLGNLVWAPWTHLRRDDTTITVDPVRPHAVRIITLPLPVSD